MQTHRTAADRSNASGGKINHLTTVNTFKLEVSVVALGWLTVAGTDISDRQAVCTFGLIYGGVPLTLSTGDWAGATDGLAEENPLPSLLAAALNLPHSRNSPLEKIRCETCQLKTRSGKKV